MEDDPEEEGELRVDKHGTKRWFDKKGRLHRDDGPAIIYVDGENRWYKNNKLHRDDGPAVEWSLVGVEDWWKDGEEYEPSAHDLMLWKMKKKEP
jgi:hypothetical protein